MNIALCGAHGVGKTTLGWELYRHYQAEHKAFLAHGIARGIIARGYSLGAAATMDSYVEYIIEQLSTLARAREYEIYISDRTLLDPYAYALVNQRNGQSLITLRELELLRRVWELEQKEYGLYLYLPVQFPLEQDGIRPADKEYQNQISQSVLGLLQDYHLPYLSIIGNKQEMMQQAIARISELMAFGKSNISN